MTVRSIERRPEVTRHDSVGVLFNLLRAVPETTRTDLALRSGLSKATVSIVVGQMLDQGFIREIGTRQPGRGRSRIVLAFQPQARYVLGAQFSEAGCRVALCDLQARPQHRAFQVVTGTRPDDFIDAMWPIVDELRMSADAPILGLGIGVPGTVSAETRLVSAVQYGWKYVPIADLVEERLGLPVRIVNRAKAAALGEIWQGEHPGVEHLVYVFIGNGIAAGIIADGRVQIGSRGGAGELGHVTVLPDGPECACGNYGCLHTLASSSAIVRMARGKARRHPEATVLTELADNTLGHITLEMLLDAARRGDSVVLETVAQVGTYVGAALANVINLINPQRIVIGGPVTQFGPPFFDAIQAEVRRRALWDLINEMSIVPSALGEEAGTIGAAALFLESVDPAEIVLNQVEQSGQPNLATAD